MRVIELDEGAGHAQLRSDLAHAGVSSVLFSASAD
jgi:hypothetical protein